MKISVTAIKTPLFELGQDLAEFLYAHLEAVPLDDKVIAITSKIVSLAERAVVAKSETTRRDLVKKEADVYLGVGGMDTDLTIKHGLMIPSAGIDESNAQENYILYPRDPYASAELIWSALRKQFGLKKFGVILTDSHTTPLRRGVNGIGLAHWGFRATVSYVGHKDLFGRPLQYTHTNTLDALAAMAVFAMGEADECTPLAVIEGVTNLDFTESSSAAEISIPPEDDLYFPLLQPGSLEVKS